MSISARRLQRAFPASASPISNQPTAAGYIEQSSDGSTAVSSLTYEPSTPTAGSAAIVDDWLIATITLNNPGGTDITPPAGWSRIANSQNWSLIGTSATYMYAHKYAPGDTTYTFTFSAAMHVNSSLLWIRGADDRATWTIGTPWRRDGTSTDQSRVIAPSATSTRDNSLALSFAFERTLTRETPAQITASGATKWYSTEQVDSTYAISTISVATEDIPTAATASGDTTFTYPNSQTTNGWGYQVMVPGIAGDDPTPPPTGTASPGLFFELPDMNTSDKKVFGHYFGPYPIAVDNVTPNNDYYARNYLNPEGEGGSFRSVGGFLRDRPKPRAPLSGDWKYKDAEEEIRQAVSVGMDGFYVNIMNHTSWHQERYELLRDAAVANYPNFKVIPMIDANGAISSQPVATVAEVINRFYGLSSTYMHDGGMVIGSFKMEGKSSAWWQSLLAALQSNYNITGRLVGVFNNWNQSDNYDAAQYATGPWGPGCDPTIWQNHGDYAGQARSRGKLWHAAVWAQDIRPNGKLFDEARNTEAIRASWTRAISDNADLVQMCTWSDYSEGSQLGLSVARGMVAADLSAYYITKWKTGSFPAILRDAAYLSYRNQMASATILGPQTEFMTHWPRPNRSAFRESVEALVFLTAPATVTITVAGVDYTSQAPAGMSAHLAPMAPGSVSVSVVRGGNEVAGINSPVSINSQAWVQDRQYFMFGSIRGTDMQFNPQRTTTGDVPNYPI